MFTNWKVDWSHLSRSALVIVTGTASTCGVRPYVHCHTVSGMEEDVVASCDGGRSFRLAYSLSTLHASKSSCGSPRQQCAASEHRYCSWTLAPSKIETVLPGLSYSKRTCLSVYNASLVPAGTCSSLHSQPNSGQGAAIHMHVLNADVRVDATGRTHAVQCLRSMSSTKAMKCLAFRLVRSAAAAGIARSTGDCKCAGQKMQPRSQLRVPMLIGWRGI
jgi:hypothetical protein